MIASAARSITRQSKTSSHSRINRSFLLGFILQATTSLSFNPVVSTTTPSLSGLQRSTRIFSSSTESSTTTASTNDDNMSADEEKPKKPSFPEDYVIPEVWEFEEQEGAMGSMNRPTAGARKEQKLPRGDHDLQLYSLGTPNGIKVTILLEELHDLKKVEYDAFKINIFDLDQFGEDFVGINPNSKIPAMLDVSHNPPIRVFESGSILKYVSDKYDGAFVPTDLAGKTECYNWLFWQMGGAPYIGGGFGHFFSYAPVQIQYAVDRFSMETKRQLDVLDKHLAGKQYLVGDEVTIADFAIFPWILCIKKFYKGADKFLQMDEYKNLGEWFDRIVARPAVQRGIRVNGFGPDAIAERHSAADFDVKTEEQTE